MSDRSTQYPESPQSNDALVERLLEAAGSRPGLPEDMKQRLATGFRQDLVSSNRHRRQRHLASALAAAAVLLLAILLSVPWRSEPIRLVPGVATVLRSSGPAAILHNDGSMVVQSNAAILAGSLLQNHEAAFTTVQYRGAELRLDENTRLAFMEDGLELLDGRIYVDSAPRGSTGSRGATVSVSVGSATIRNAGTQFSVSHVGGRVSAKLREGALDIGTSAGTRRLDASGGGRHILIDGSGRLEVRQLSRSGPAWQWIHTLPAAYDVDGRSIATAIARIARDAGVQVRFADDAARLLAERNLVHGNPEAMVPMAALSTILETSSLSFSRESSDSVVVSIEP